MLILSTGEFRNPRQVILQNHEMKRRFMKMKKILAILTALTLIAGAAALPALAEETTESVDQISSATTQAGKGGRDNRQQKPGRNGQAQDTNSKAPDTNSQVPDSSQTQAPAQDNQNVQTTQQAPGKHGRGSRMQAPGQNVPVNTQPQDPAQGSTEDSAAQAQAQDSQDSQSTQQVPRKSGKGVRGTKENKSGSYAIFDELLNAGVISQEVYDAIMNYLQAQVQVQQPAAETTIPTGNT